MDRISNLPDEIICHIGSFLSAKEAAFAMVLSTRWRNLFNIVQELHFDSKNRGSFTEFADRVFALPVTSRIKKFSLIFGFVYPKEYDLINSCLSHVLKRGVLDLELQINHFREEGYSLPLEAFTCETVTKLKLGSGFAIDFLPSKAYLPALKTLCLDSIRFYEFGRCAFNTLLSAAPVLEELVIDGINWERWKWSFIVSSPTLQRLTMRREYYPDDDFDLQNIALDTRGLAYDFDSLSLDTPALTYLEYADYVPKEYPIVNLSSLIEAKLDLRADHGDDRLWDESHAKDFHPMNLINGLKNVEILDLTEETMEMIYVFRKAIPVFEKLHRVSINLRSNFCSLKVLLKKSPNLKTLIIESSLHYNFRREEAPFLCHCVSGNSFLLLCPVEVLKIMKYKGTIQELEHMKHFLKKLSSLEMVEVCAQVSDEERVQVMADLLMLPRTSTNCKIQVKFS